jgi:hypothetical protein
MRTEPSAIPLSDAASVSSAAALNSIASAAGHRSSLHWPGGHWWGQGVQSRTTMVHRHRRCWRACVGLARDGSAGAAPPRWRLWLHGCAGGQPRHLRGGWTRSHSEERPGCGRLDLRHGYGHPDVHFMAGRRARVRHGGHRERLESRARTTGLLRVHVLTFGRLHLQRWRGFRSRTPCAVRATALRTLPRRRRRMGPRQGARR